MRLFLDANVLFTAARDPRGKAALVIELELAAKDIPIFQAAVVCDASHLLTGDLKDFGPLMNRPEETSGILVQTVSDFLDGSGAPES